MAAKRAAAAAAAPSVLPIIAVGLGVVLLSRVIPNLVGDAAAAAAGAAADAGEAVAGGTNDFVRGFFGIDAPTFTAEDFVNAQDNPEDFELTTRALIGPDVLGVPTPDARSTQLYSIPIEELPDEAIDQLGILDLENFPEGRIVLRRDTVLNDASIAGDLGGNLNQPFVNLYVDPLFDVGPVEAISAQDVVGVFTDPIGAVQDLGSFTKKVFGGIF